MRKRRLFLKSNQENYLIRRKKNILDLFDVIVFLFLYISLIHVDNGSMRDELMLSGVRLYLF